jgi:hypothetical protein
MITADRASSSQTEVEQLSQDPKLKNLNPASSGPFRNSKKVLLYVARSSSTVAVQLSNGPECKGSILTATVTRGK